MPFFETSLNSALNQTFQNLEIIIIYDDNNEFDLNYILEKQKLDQRIKIIKNNKNMGAGPSRNKGILASNGNYIAFLDCDDYWHHDKLQKQMHFMKDKNLPHIM